VEFEWSKDRCTVSIDGKRLRSRQRIDICRPSGEPGRVYIRIDGDAFWLVNPLDKVIDWKFSLSQSGIKSMTVPNWWIPEHKLTIKGGSIA